MAKDIKTYDAFWLHYLREHSQPATRGWHYFGTLLGLGVLIFALVSGRYWLIVFTFVSGYFFAWLSHGFIEKNRPATFTYPIWSFISDFKMLYCYLTGQMPRQLVRAGVKTV